MGERRILLGCWGSLNDPAHCDFRYETMSDWGRKMYVTPGVVVDGKLVTNDLVDINLGIRILLGHSYYEDWVKSGREVFVTKDPLGNPVDERHPWNQHTIPKPQARDWDNAYSWTMSPRWFDGTDHLALDTGGGPIARLWSTALSGLVNAGGYVVATGHSVQINLPRTALKPEVSFEWKIPKWSNALERNRARTYFQAYAAGLALYFCEKALAEVRGGRTDTWTKFEVPDEAVSVGFTEAVRGCSATTWSSRRGRSRTTTPTRRPRGTAACATPTARPVRTRTPCRTRRSSRRTRPTTSRASTSCARSAASTRACRAASTCTPAAGNVVEHLHTPSVPVKPY